MSNRRKLKPPATVAAMAAAYGCGHCDADVDAPYLGDDGIWHLRVHHDASCPVLAGIVSPAPSGMRAALAAARATGERAMYLGSQP